MKLAEELSQAEQEAVREGLSEEEQAVFDILTKPEPALSEKERNQVKKVSRSLLEKLKKEKLVLGLAKQTKGQGRCPTGHWIVLDQGLPEVYDEKLYELKCENLYRHVFDAYYGGDQSVYVVG